MNKPPLTRIHLQSTTTQLPPARREGVPIRDDGGGSSCCRESEAIVTTTELKELAEAMVAAIYPLPPRGTAPCNWPSSVEYHTAPKYPCLVEERKGEWKLQFASFPSPLLDLDWLTSPAGMCWILEQMAAREITISLIGGGATVTIWREDGAMEQTSARSVSELPLAVAAATLAMVRAGKVEGQ